MNTLNFPTSERAGAFPALPMSNHSPQNETAAQRYPIGVELTGKGWAYCFRHDREAIERRIDRHLALVTALLAILDHDDGDPDLEHDLVDGGEAYLEGDPLDEGEADDSDREPSLGAPEVALGSADHFTIQHNIFASATPRTSQADWARGHGDDD
jgi:hypothetical protein